MAAAKKRVRKASDLKRGKPVRDRYAKVLIVCEGKKTEPLYFNGLRDHYRLNSANIVVTGDCGSDPGTVLGYAKQLYKDERNAGDPFDRVYCVFDKDNHANYEQTLSNIRRAVPGKKFFAINSVPCFEYWLLLHFIDSTKPYTAQPGNSACNQLLTDLREYLPDYHKGQSHIFQILFEQLEQAKQNAAKGLNLVQAAETDNPSTHVHYMIEFLQKIK